MLHDDAITYPPVAATEESVISSAAISMKLSCSTLNSANVLLANDQIDSVIRDMKGATILQKPYVSKESMVILFN